MATTTKVPGTTEATIAGFFKDENQAENAIEELKTAGFSDTEIGIATPDRDDRKTGKFWDKLSKRFGKHEHTEQTTDLQDSLRDSGVPEQQASYFSSQVTNGGALVSVHAGPDRSPEAVSILQQNGADTGAASTEWHPPQDGSKSGAPLQHIQLLGEILRVYKLRK